MSRNHSVLFLIAAPLLPFAIAPIAKGADTAQTAHTAHTAHTIGQPIATSAMKSTHLPVLFFENQGQIDPAAKFAARRGGLGVYMTNDTFVLELDETAASVDGESDYRGAVLRYAFEGASKDVVLRGEDPNAAKFNFLRGQDPGAWRSNVPSFGAVRYQGLYPGVDLIVREQQGSLEYDLELAPGASLDQVRIRCEGAESLSLGAKGELVATTKWGELTQRFPTSWQLDAKGNRHPVDSHFVMLDSQTYGFAAPNLDAGLGLVVDPGISYGAYLGGSGTEHGCGVSVDQGCNLFIAGDTKSIDFPTQAGSFDVTQNGDVDVFCIKTDATGSQMHYSTYIGGSLGDFGHGVVVDKAGYAYVTGGTKSLNFPVTVGAFDTSENGAGDTFVTKLTPEGDSLVWSSFLGGASEEGSLGGQGIAVDDFSNVYVGGFAGSSNFPTTPGAYDTTFNGIVDVFCTKFLPNGSGLAWSTFIGGIDVDIANSIDIDTQGNAYVGGWSISNDYPTSPGAYASVPNGNSNGIVSKISADGSQLLLSSFTGGSSEVVRGVAVEGQDVYAAGYTLSSVFPTTVGAFDTTPNGNGDGFVLRLNSTGTAAVYATYIGGIEVDVINGIDTDVNGEAYLAGWTESLDYPTTSTAFDPTYNGAQDAICTRLTADGSAADYSTYIGGSGFDVGFAMNVHAVGSFYEAGGTFSTDFPTTTNSIDQTWNGNEDIFMVLMPAGPSTCVTTSTQTEYGTSEVDSGGGHPHLQALGLPKVPNQTFGLRLDNTVANQPVFLLIGVQPTAVPFDHGTLYVVPNWLYAVGMTDGTGTLVLPLPVGDNANFCDDDVYLQMAVMDPASPTHYQVALSNGLHLLFGN